MSDHRLPPASHAQTLPRFLTVGVLNTLVGYGVIFIALRWLNFGPLAANALGYGLALMVSFALNRAWTFGSRASIAATLPKFLLVFVIAWLANLAAVWLATTWFASGVWPATFFPVKALRDWLGTDYLSQLCGIPAYVSTSYLLNHYYTFAPPITHQELS